MKAAAPTSRQQWGWLAAAAAVALGSGGFLWWMSVRSPSVQFLPRSTPAEWIVFPNPPEANARGVVARTAEFRRRFAVATVPSDATLSVRGMTRCELTLNGVRLQLPESASWKVVQAIPVGGRLRPGDNELRVSVEHASGPPALWLRLHGHGLEVSTDEQWEVSFAGAAWRQARRASTPMPRPRPGNTLAGGEQPLPSLAACAPWLGLFALGAAGLQWGWRRWFRQPRLTASSRWRFLDSPVTVAGIASIALWGILFANNLNSLPRRVGFDVDHHLEYVRYLMEHRALPSAQDGMEMYNPPLYYGLAATILGLGGLSATEDAGMAALRVFSLLLAAIHLGLILACLRLLFPGEVEKPLYGLVLAACLPAHLYLSHYATNETLTALLVTAALYFGLRVLCRDDTTLGNHVALGMFLGAALLTKMSALLAVPWVFGALGVRLISRRAPARDWLRTVGVAAFACASVSGWHYVRAWVRHGTPLVGAWDTRSGFAWWQDEGYRTLQYFLRFGEALVRPCFSGMHGFVDGVYSTLWGDTLCGGGGGLEFRPPWNYDLMAAGQLLALLPTLALLVGAVMTVVRLIRCPSAEWLMLAGLAGSFTVALLYMTLRVPCYAQVKATYGLLVLLPFCALGALGLQALSRGGRTWRALWLVLFGVWAMNSYATYWIRGDSIPAHLAAGRDLAQAGRGAEAAERFARVLVLDPHNQSARKLLAWLLLQNGQPAEARTLATQAVTEDPRDAEGHVALALVLAATAQTAEAVPHLRRALDLAPEHLMAHRKLAALLFDLGKIDESLAASREGLAVAPTDSELHRTLSLAEQRLPRTAQNPPP